MFTVLPDLVLLERGEERTDACRIMVQDRAKGPAW
jgi:hypothetical protein